MSTIIRNLIITAGLIPLLSFTNNVQASTSEDDWKAEAKARIEKHRKEDVQIHVTKNGKSVKGAVVKIEMVKNECLFGSNIFGWEQEEGSLYNRRYADLFNFATLGFYWAGYESEEGKPGYAYSEKVAAWCAANGIRTKGHPLAWNTGEPSWIKDFTDDELYDRQVSRVNACTEHFRGSIDTWDVVNEIVGWDRDKFYGYAPRLTAMVTNKSGKITFTKDCYAAARKGNPQATLLINDWMLGERYATILSQLKDANGNFIFDAIGIQSHMHSGTWSNERIWETCEEFAKFGKPIHFTEVTILSTREEHDWDSLTEDVPPSPEGEALQRDEVVRFYTMLFSHPAVAAITWWDFSDKNSWRHAPAGLIHKDMSPKPAYDALKKLIKEDWATNTTLKTGSSGTAQLRAFRGEYRFTITLPNGQKITKEAAVVKGNSLIELEIN
jgi:GH35 family endo-1,4-beta-xylanase